jgi:hypothetical protein
LDAINRIYRRVVGAIALSTRSILIFLEGDYFSSRFEGLEPPFADNLSTAATITLPLALARVASR